MSIIKWCFLLLFLAYSKPIDLQTSENRLFYDKFPSNATVVYSLFFTSCKKICPVITQRVLFLQRKFKEKNVIFVSITVDPEHDNVERLKKFKEKFATSNQGNWILVTGTKKNVFSFIQNKLDFKIEHSRLHSNSLSLFKNGEKIGNFSIFDESEMNRLERKINSLLQTSASLSTSHYQ